MELCVTSDSATNHVGEVQRPLCHCLNVSETEIRDAIQSHDLQTVRAVAKTCGAGGGCTACHRHIKRLLNEHTVERRMQSVGVTSDFNSQTSCCFSTAQG